MPASVIRTPKLPYPVAVEIYITGISYKKYNANLFHKTHDLNNSSLAVIDC